MSSKLTELTELILPENSDIFYVVDDPAGNPAGKKITYANILAGSLQDAPSDGNYYARKDGAWESVVSEISIGDSIAGGTPGSILYIDSSGLLAQDNSNLFWNAASLKLNIRESIEIDSIDDGGFGDVSTKLILKPSPNTYTDSLIQNVALGSPAQSMSIQTVSSDNSFYTQMGLGNDGSVTFLNQTNPLMDLGSAFNRSYRNFLLGDNVQLLMGDSGATDYYQKFDGTNSVFHSSGLFTFDNGFTVNLPGATARASDVVFLIEGYSRTTASKALFNVNMLNADGNRKLLDLQVLGVSKLNCDVEGDLFCGQSITAGTFYILGYANDAVMISNANNGFTFGTLQANDLKRGRAEFGQTAYLGQKTADRAYDFDYVKIKRNINAGSTYDVSGYLLKLEDTILNPAAGTRGYINADDGFILKSTFELLVTNKISFTQTDGNEYIDSLADGYVDIGATTGVRINTNAVFDNNGYGFIKDVTFALALGTPATVGANKTNVVIIPRDGKIVKCFAYAKTGPVGADLIVDINLNGTSIWASTPANRITIADGASAGTQTSFDTTALTEGDYMTIDIDQIGSGTAGQDITIVLHFQLRNQ